MSAIEQTRETAEKSALVTAVEAELVAAGRLDSAKSQIAVLAAERVSSPMGDSGSSFAALLRELRVCLDDALGGVSVGVDPLDEIRRRRELHRSS